QFGSELDAATQAQLARGERTVEALNQGQYAPMPVEEQIAVIFAATQGYLDGLDVDRVKNFNEGLIHHMRSTHADVLESIRETKDLTEETEAGLRKAIETFLKDFAPETEEAETAAASV
ncbi:MAG: F0F1 ATP synthase subunit alpha, partial [Thermoleophilia bacterium]|nr:F0F1 ATP synthase subunit alpha [Thermoleophilia bacterium]